MLCKRYLVATEAQDRSGPVQAAVRAVGYVSEDEEEDEEEGSSVEEEAEVDEENGHFPSSEHLPTYSNAVPIGTTGYPIEKKRLPIPGHDSPPGGRRSPVSVPVEVVNGAVSRGHHNHGIVVPNGATFANGTADPAVGGAVAGAGVTRRPSKRQQEKAPEGKAPRMVDAPSPPQADDEPGPAPVEPTRFHEGL